MRRWLPLGVLCAAQFVMVLDSSVMNVSISAIVDDLNTTIQGVQLAITAYTLVMAAFMLVGARLGDIWGRNRAFSIGLAVYGLGSLTTALSPSLPVLLVGWSCVEGLGAVLVIPAIAALVVTQYEGKERALAYGMLGGATGIAVAAGPLIGGWVTTNYSWRWVFVGEVVVVVAILIVRGRIFGKQPRLAVPPTFDGVGATLSALGLGLVVYGVLKSSSWGWIESHNPPSVGGHDIEPFGMSLVPFLILGGLAVLQGFMAWERRLGRLGRDPLLDLALLKIRELRAGLATLALQQLVLMGTFFVLPVYLQVVLGLDAFSTGKRLLPMSIAMLVGALTGPKLATRFAARGVARLGLAAIAISLVLLVATIEVELHEWEFSLALAIFGLGGGLLVSQLGNVIMSSVDAEHTNEAGGLQGMSQNLGASLGTALLGSVLLAGLTSGFVQQINQSDALSSSAQEKITATATADGLDVVPIDEVRSAARDAGLSPDAADAVASSYGHALLDALRTALSAGAIIAVLGIALTAGLPGGAGRRRRASSEAPQ